MGRGKVVSVVSAPVVEEASKRAVPQFLQKTYEMVESPTTNKHVTWTSRGRSFVILNKQGFEKTILPRYFKHSQFTSFVRQLNMYGFSKSGEKDWWEFSHPNFLRGREDMLLRIHRKLSAAQGAEGATKHDVLKLREDKERIMDELYEVKTSTSELTNHVSEVMKLNETLRNDLAAANNKVASLESTLGNVIKFLSQVHTAQPGSVSPDSVAPVGLTFDSSNDVDESISRALKRRRLADGGSFGTVYSSPSSASPAYRHKYSGSSSLAVSTSSLPLSNCSDSMSDDAQSNWTLPLPFSSTCVPDRKMSDEELLSGIVEEFNGQVEGEVDVCDTASVHTVDDSSVSSQDNQCLPPSPEYTACAVNLSSLHTETPFPPTHSRATEPLFTGVDCETDPEAVKALSVASGLGSYFGYDIPNSPSAAVPELKLDPNDFASTGESYL
eukprot:TRINITY_DN2317_c0_g1_i4.p1 TRINITY_DN2317_c0_g1~~TRINITY_DN2317_c0_g1_i4.p1  ORF type:complete len:441 (+),score=62.42 TRINITY_DN2317_c0_g1_i4:150-1472(+)